MPVAIIIGFEYVINHISIMIIDLYRAYTYFSSLGFNIYLMSDIVNPTITDNLESIINNSNENNNKNISNNIYDFVKNFEEYKFNTVRSAKDLIISLENIIFTSNDKYIAVYYSGHAKKGGLIAPNEDMIPIILFRDTILNRLFKDSFVIFIMDCCNPQGGLLPYRLIVDEHQHQSFRLLQPYRFDTVVEKNVILLASTNDNEKSYAAKHGSFFTRYLFENLINIATGNVIACRSIVKLLAKITNDIKINHPEQQQVPYAYVSYPIDKMIWPWLYGSPITIVMDRIDNTVIVQHRF